MTQQRFFLKLTLKKNVNHQGVPSYFFETKWKIELKIRKCELRSPSPMDYDFYDFVNLPFFGFYLLVTRFFLTTLPPPPHIRFDATCLVSRFYCFVWKRKMIAIHGREYSREFRIRYLVLLLSYSVNFYYRNKHLSNNLQF